MTANDVEKLKIGDKVKSLGSGLVYKVVEINPDIVLVRPVMGKNLTVHGLSHFSEWIILDDLLSLIRDARDALKHARNQDCTCSNFKRQYEGCSCDAGKKVNAAEKHFWRLIKTID